MKLRITHLAITLGFLAVVHSAEAQATAFTYQGRLDLNGSPAAGLYDLRFKLYEDSLGNTQVGSSYLTNAVPTTAGLFVVTVDFGAAPFTGSNYWLEVDVKTNGFPGYTVLSPLQALTPAPYAIFANTSSNAATLGGSVTASSITALNNAISTEITRATSAEQTLALNINNETSRAQSAEASLNSGISAEITRATGAESTLAVNLNNEVNRALSAESNLRTSLWGLTGNTVSPGQFLGSVNNTPVEVWAGNQRALRIEPNTVSNAPNFVAGSPWNYVSNGVQGATIGGGGGAGTYYLESYYPASANFTNSVSAHFGTVSGGGQNSAGGQFATIGGGAWNGATNTYSTVGGGYYNYAQGIGSTVAGGAGVYVGNYASGDFSAIGGGADNFAQGQYAVVPGGYNNTAQGRYSIACGFLAHAVTQGSFVWADYNSFPFNPDAQSGPQGIANSFNVRCTGGFYIITGINNTNGDATSGIFVGSGGSGWNVLSDRNAKTDLASLDVREVLDRLASVPVLTWNYKSQDASVRHIGPMAQDFNATFGVGEPDKLGEKKYINSLDEEGVALAAIQGLNQKVDDKAARIQAQESQIRSQAAEIAQLKLRLDRLERLLAK